MEYEVLEEMRKRLLVEHEAFIADLFAAAYELCVPSANPRDRRENTKRMYDGNVSVEYVDNEHINYIAVDVSVADEKLRVCEVVRYEAHGEAREDFIVPGMWMQTAKKWIATAQENIRLRACNADRDRLMKLEAKMLVGKVGF